MTPWSGLPGSPAATGTPPAEITGVAGTTGRPVRRSKGVPGTGETGAQTVTDTSSSTIGTGNLTLDKTIGPRSMAGVCGTDGTGYGEPSSFAPSETKFGKGDVVCFKLRIDFDSLTKTRNPVVTDFLPVGTEYVAGSAVATTNDQRAPAVLTTTADSLTWTLGTTAGSGAKYVDLGAVFEWVFAVRVTDAAPVGSPDILGNSMKLRTEDSAGRGRSYRDEVDFTIVPAAPLRVVKGVQSVDSPAAGPNGLNSNVDGLPVREGSVVRFRIDLTNDGSAGTSTNYAVGGVDVWDVLPEHVRCVDVANISGLGSIPTTPVIRCTDPGDPNQPSFALNGSRLIQAVRPGEEKAGEVLDLASGKVLLHVQEERALGLALSPDGTVLAVGTQDNKVQLWNVDRGQKIGTLQGHIQGVIGVAFSPDGRTLASASSDKTIVLWRLAR